MPALPTGGLPTNSAAAPLVGKTPPPWTASSAPQHRPPLTPLRKTDTPTTCCQRCNSSRVLPVRCFLQMAKLKRTFRARARTAGGVVARPPATSGATSPAQRAELVTDADSVAVDVLVLVGMLEHLHAAEAGVAAPPINQNIPRDYYDMITTATAATFNQQITKLHSLTGGHQLLHQLNDDIAALARGLLEHYMERDRTSAGAQQQRWDDAYSV